jgi:non-specific serine/threonine protein kinase
MESNLPVARTGFVGRKLELAEVGKLLARAQLVTLCGPGGCGKTRLAIEVARAALAEHPDGSCFVDLAAIASAGLVVSAVATAAGLSAPAIPDLEVLVGRLGARAGLLLMDNCEHVLGETAGVVDALARGCPRLHLLTTSREPLSVEGEQVYRIGGLPESDSIRLFVDRARLTDAAFELDESSASSVAAICQRLDGLPLGVELAAAQAGSLTPADILERLDQRFRVLVVRGSAVERHRTMRAAIEWSEALLSDAERVVFRRLGVFVGGFDLPAAESVASGAGLEREQVVPLLQRLVERSLVQFERATGRYRLLETLREHALDRLAEAGEVELVRDAHASHYCNVAWQRFPLMLADSPAPLNPPEHLIDLGNHRAALERLNATPSAPLAKLALGLMSVWLQVRMDEGRRWLETALADSDPDLEMRYWLLWALSNLTFQAGDLEATHRYNLQARQLSESWPDTREAARISLNLAAWEAAAGNAQASLAYAERAVDLARQARTPGRKRVLALAHLNLAGALLLVGEPDRALVAAEECVAVADELGEPQMRRMAHQKRVDVHRSRGDLQLAIALHREALLIGPVDAVREVLSLATMAALLIATGRRERGLRLVGAVDVHCERMGLVLPSLPEAFPREVGDAMETLGPRANNFRRSGRRMSLEEARAFALEDPGTPPAPASHLSRRELQVAHLVRQGLTDPQIAKRLFIATRTAEGHVESLRNKLGVNSRVEVATWVVEHLPPDADVDPRGD